MGLSEAIVSGLFLGLFVALAAGPTFFNILRYSTHHSYKAGLIFIFGISFSDILYAVLVNLASSWMTFLNDHEDIVGYAGGGLFILIGMVGLFRKFKPKKPQNAKDIKISKQDYFKLWGSGFLMNALNPGAIILWIGAALKAADYAIFQRIIFFGIALIIIFSGDMTKVFLSDKIRKWLTPRKTLYLNRISAGIIMLFGILLWASIFFNVQPHLR